MIKPVFKALATSVLGGGTVPLLIVLAIVSAFGGGYFKGRIDGSQKAEIERLEGERDQLIADQQRLNTQLRIARQAIADVNKQSETDARTLGALKGKVDEYEKRLVDENGCFVLDHDDADFLQNIQ